MRYYVTIYFLAYNTIEITLNTLSSNYDRHIIMYM